MEDGMKAMRQCLSVMALASSTLVGCGTYTTDYPYPTAQTADTERMAAVEAAARRAGVEVHWINYPRKPPTGP
jgi:hypothetical protein